MEPERRIGVGLAVAGVAAAVGFGALATGEAARFTLTDDPAAASVSIDGMVGAIVFGLLGAAAGGGAHRAGGPALVRLAWRSSASLQNVVSRLDDVASTAISPSTCHIASRVCSMTSEKPSVLAMNSRSVEQPRAVDAARAAGARVDPVELAEQPLGVAQRGVDEREQVVPERRGLRVLQVRLVRHHSLGVLLGAVDGGEPRSGRRR